MRAVGDPPSLGFEVFPWGDGGRSPDDGDQVSVATHLHAEHAEARLLAVEGDALDAAREVFQERVAWRRECEQGHSCVLTSRRAGSLAKHYTHGCEECKP